MNIKATFQSWNMHQKRILVRADLNVPLNSDGTIMNDYRLQALQPTIDHIQQQGGMVILMTHLGRPEKSSPALSTKHLVPWFNKNNYEVIWCADITPQAQPFNNKQIILLENLRFFPQETSLDKQFAQQLAQWGDYFIQDAFGALHRTDTSISLVPVCFKPDHRSIGLLIEKEIQMLNRLIESPQKPFILVSGGGKVPDKIPLLHNLLDKVTDILLCPATVFSFLHAQGISTGKSLVDKNVTQVCKKLLSQTKKKGVKVHFPIDYQIALHTIDGPLRIVASDAIPEEGIGISIGPKTIELFAPIIKQAHTLFFNAAMGFPSRKETMEGTQALLKLISESAGFTVIGGGDSVTAAQQMGIENKMSYLSTGGGATLTYLSGKKLPGLEVFYTSKN